MKKLEDEHSAKLTRLSEEIKRLEPFESRAKVLEEEVTTLMADLQVSEHEAVDAKQREKDTKAIMNEARDLMRQREKKIAKERRAIKDDLPRQLERYKLENGVLLPPSDDEVEDEDIVEGQPSDD